MGAKDDKKRVKKLKSKKLEAEEELNNVQEIDAHDIVMEQKSDKKRGKKVKSKKAEAEEHEEELKRLQEKVSHL
jgi:nucleolar complex protein 2